MILPKDDNEIKKINIYSCVIKYFQRAYKGGIPDRFLNSFLTRFGYSPTFIDQQMQVNEDGEIVDAQGNLIEGLPNIALIGEKIKQEMGE